MKKLFGLVILSFLICTSSFAKQSIKNILNIGASKKEVCKALGFSAQVDHIEKHNSQLCHAGSNPKKNFAYSYKYQTEVISTGFKVWYVFENVTVPIKCGIIAFCKKGNGTLKGVFTIVDYDTEFEAKQDLERTRDAAEAELAEDRLELQEEALADKTRVAEDRIQTQRDIATLNAQMKGVRQ